MSRASELAEMIRDAYINLDGETLESFLSELEEVASAAERYREALEKVPIPDHRDPAIYWVAYEAAQEALSKGET